MAADSDDKKYFDVSQPGKTAPEPTGRPIIVANRSMVKDSTLTHQSDDEPDASKKTSTSVGSKSEAKSVNPPHEDDIKAKKSEEDTKKDSEKPEEPKADDETQSDDDQIAPGRVDEKKAVELTEAEQIRKKEMDKLIASGKYVVPIGHIERNRKVRRAAAVLIAILVLGIAAGVALKKIPGLR